MKRTLVWKEETTDWHPVMTKEVTPGDSIPSRTQRAYWGRKENRGSKTGRKEGKKNERATQVQHSSGQAQAPLWDSYYSEQTTGKRPQCHSTVRLDLRWLKSIFLFVLDTFRLILANKSAGEFSRGSASTYALTCAFANHRLWAQPCKSNSI